MPGAAFFDLDKTLIEGSSAIHFGRAAYKHGMVSRRQIARDAWANIKFRLNGSTDAGTDELRQRILDSITGQRTVDLARLGPDVLAGILPLLYREVLDEAYAHQDAGRAVYIVTAASQELADVLAHVLVLDGGIGMRSEVRDGVYTGRPAGPFTYREGKAEAIRELAAREGIDLAESFAYSDSESDLPMMRAVGHPVAVNPDRELERVARQEGWRIMRFDKLGRRLRWAPAVAAWRSWAVAVATWRRGPAARAGCADAGLCAPLVNPRAAHAAVAGHVVGVAQEASPVSTVAAHAQARAYEEQVAPATSASTGFATVRQPVAVRRWSAMATPSCSGQSVPEKRTRCPRFGVRSLSLSVIAGRTITSTAGLVGLAGASLVARVRGRLHASAQSPVALVVALPGVRESSTGNGSWRTVTFFASNFPPASLPESVTLPPNFTVVGARAHA